MIDLLVAYARDHGLVVEPGFAPKTVKWALDFAPDGRFLALTPLGDLTVKNSPGRQFACCPELSQGELVACKGSHYLTESASVVALYLPDNAAPAEAAKAHSKHTFFTGLLAESSTAIPALSAIAASLQNDAILEAIRSALTAARAKPTDRVTVSVSGRFPLEDESWRPWWRVWRSAISSGQPSGEGSGQPSGQPSGEASGEVPGGPMRCFVTGERVKPAPTHLKISGLADVGGMSTGAPLVGFDKDAFCSFGLEQSANAAMSEATAAAYRAALNDLLTRHSVKIAGAKVAHWFNREIPPQDDPIAFLLNPEAPAGPGSQAEAVAQQRAHELLNAIRSGRRPDLGSAEYFALTLSGAGGRVMLRDWMTGRFEDLLSNTLAWFESLAIVRRDGDGLARSPRLMAIVGSLVRDLNDAPAPLITRLWRVAVHHEPIPAQLMVQALARAKIDIVQDQPATHARMGLLKAYHVRRKEGNAMSAYLNEDHPDPAYHCGRLMAVLARVQNAALGDVGAGVVQRYYAAASSTPALVLGRLVRTSQFHLNKLEGGLARYFDHKMAGIWSHIEDRVPPTLSLEQQSLFALGYYQQMAHDWPKKKPAPAGAPESSPESSIPFEGEINE